MKSFVFAFVFAAALPSLACTVQFANGQNAGRVYGDNVFNASGAPVGFVQGDLVYAVSGQFDSVGAVVGSVTPSAILNPYRGAVGFTAGNTIYNYLGEARGVATNCSQVQKGAALLLLLGVN